MKTITRQLLWLPIALLLLSLSQLQAEETVTVEISYGYDSGGTATIFDKTLNQQLVLTENKAQVIKGHQIVISATGKEGRTFYSGQWWPTGKSERNPIKALPLELTADVNLSVSLTFQYLASYSIRGEAGGTLKGYFLYKSDPDAWFPDEVPFDSPKRFFLDGNDTFVFKAQPSEGYKLKAWYLNGELVQGESSLTYKVVHPRTSIDVEVEFSKEVAEAKVTMVQPDATQGSMTAHYTNDATKAVTDGMSVAKDTQVTFVVTPKEGYEMASWKVDDQPKELESADPNKLTLTVTADLKVEPVLKEKVVKYTVTLTQPEATQGLMTAHYTNDAMKAVTDGMSVEKDTQVTFVVTPKEGYEMDSWKVDDQSKAIDEAKPNELTLTVTGDLKVEPVLKAKVVKYTVTLTQPDATQGSMTAHYTNDATKVVTDGMSVEKDTKVTFVVTPKEGYEMDSWKVDDQSKAIDEAKPNELTLTVTADLKVEPVLKESELTEGKITMIQPKDDQGKETGVLRASYTDSDYGMTAIVNDGDMVDFDTKVTFEVEPAEGYEMDHWMIDDQRKEPNPNNANITEIVIKGNLKVEPILKKKTSVTPKKGTITFRVKGTEGEIQATYEDPVSGKPSKIIEQNPTPLPIGTKVTLKATLNDGYEVTYTNNNKPVAKEMLSADGSVYTFTVEGDASVVATIAQKPVVERFIVTYTSNPAEGGTVKLFNNDGSEVASGTSIVSGTKMYVEVKPAAKYELETLQVGETKIPAGDEKLIKQADGGFKYAFTVTEATKIQATFKLINAIEQLTAGQVAVYVTNGGTRLEVAGAAEGAEVRLYDYTGQLLLASTEHALDISALPAGSYIVLVGNYTTRIVK